MCLVLELSIAVLSYIFFAFTNNIFNFAAYILC